MDQVNKEIPMDNFGMVTEETKTIYRDRNGTVHETWEAARAASVKGMIAEVLEKESFLDTLEIAAAARIIAKHFDIIPRSK